MPGVCNELLVLGRCTPRLGSHQSTSLVQLGRCTGKALRTTVQDAGTWIDKAFSSVRRPAQLFHSLSSTRPVSRKVQDQKLEEPPPRLTVRVSDEPVKRCRAALSAMPPRLGLILASRAGKSYLFQLVSQSTVDIQGMMAPVKTQAAWLRTPHSFQIRTYEAPIPMCLAEQLVVQRMPCFGTVVMIPESAHGCL